MFDFLHTNTSRRSMLELMGFAGAASLGLSGCVGVAGNDSDTSTSGARKGFRQAPVKVPAKYKGRTKVLFWAPFTGINFQVLSSLLTKFNDSQKDIYAGAESVGGYADLAQKFTAALQAKEVPDIVCFPEHRWIQYWQAEALAPLDKYFDDDWSTKVYMEQFVAEGQAQGKTFQVPFARSTPLFYYNKTRFKEAGLPEQGPGTWPEFAEMAADLVRLKAAGKALKVFPFKNDDEWYGQAHIWAWGGRFSEGTKVLVDQGPMLEWLTWKNKFIHRDNFGYVAKSPVTDFTTGISAATHASTATLAQILHDAKFDVGTHFMLGKASPGPKVPIGGSGLAVVRAESTDRQDAAAKVLRFMAEPEVCATWHLGTGYLPIVKKAAELPNVQANVKKIPNYGVALDQVKNAKQSDTITWFDSPVDDINRAMGLVYGDGKDPRTVVADLQKQLDAKMAKYKDTISKVMAKGN